MELYLHSSDASSWRCALLSKRYDFTMWYLIKHRDNFTFSTSSRCSSCELVHTHTHTHTHTGECILKFPDWVDNRTNNNNNKNLLRSNTKGYGSKTHQTESQNSDTTAPSGTELYHLQFSVQAASPESFGYNLIVHNFHGGELEVAFLLGGVGRSCCGG
jgi:hypothetical protein